MELCLFVMLFHYSTPCYSLLVTLFTAHSLPVCVCQESGIELGPGLFFADGKRKVDYVLCYKYKKRRASKPRLSITSNGSIPIPIPGNWETEPESGEAGAPAGDVEEPKLSDAEKAVMREEFEAGLLEAGLQIERDKEVCIWL